jgi:hypothetical protein
MYTHSFLSIRILHFVALFALEFLWKMFAYLGSLEDVVRIFGFFERRYWHIWVLWKTLFAYFGFFGRLCLHIWVLWNTLFAYLGSLEDVGLSLELLCPLSWSRLLIALCAVLLFSWW